MRYVTIVLAGLLGVAGCGDTTDDSGSGSSGGAAGSGGSGGGAAGSGGSGGGAAGSGGSGTSGSGGSSGSGTAASGGTAGTAASGGTAGTGGGTAGTGGSTGGTAGAGAVSGSGGIGGAAGPCTTADDCKLVNNCCDCLAIPKSQKDPACGMQTCFAPACEPLGIEPKDVTCFGGACTLGANCDTSTVSCEITPPVCGPGQVPSVDQSGTCYGPCIDATQCASIPSCADCDGPNQQCISMDAFTMTKRCITVPPKCENDRTCACLGPIVCIDPFNACSDNKPGEISCGCPAC